MDAKVIEESRFSIVFPRGYKVAEVDEFLDEMAADVDRLHAEIRELRAEIDAFRGREKHVAEMEQTLRDTLLTAQRAAEDVLRASREKATAMIKDSELEGRRIVEEAERQAVSAAQRLEGVNRDVAGVKALIRRILGEQLRLLDESYPDAPPPKPAAEPAHKSAKTQPTLADFDRTQEFSVREVREQAMEEARAESPVQKNNAN